jgi:hypothetical protein
MPSTPFVQQDPNFHPAEVLGSCLAASDRAAASTGRKPAGEPEPLLMLEAPRRVNYFSGRLLSAEDFQTEQSYWLGKHRSHRRHQHGSGVVCGLAVTPSGCGGVTVEPGLAIDGFGREIVVPEPRQMPDPRQPIDDRGEPCGERVDSEVLTICLAYTERPNGDGDPAPFVREGYRLEVRPGRYRPPLPTPIVEAALAGSADEVARALCEVAAGEGCISDHEWVAIATIDWGAGELKVDPCPRPMTCATNLLIELVLGLVQRVHALEERS